MPLEQSILEAIIKKSQVVIDTLMPQIEEARHNIEIAQQAMKLIEKEGTGQQEALPLEVAPAIQVISDKYATMSMPEAFTDILLARDEYLGAEEIIAELQKHGFKSKSKNLKRDVYTRLYRLADKGKLLSRKEGPIKKYSVQKEAKNESQEVTVQE